MSVPVSTVPIEKPLLKQIEQKLADLQHDPNFLVYAFATSFVALLISIYLFRKLLGLGASRRVMLVGLSDSGKTLALAQLVGRRFVATVSSLKVTECDFELGGRVRTLVDLPGADRLRAQCWEQLQAGVAAIIFWIDSKSFNSNLADVADLLYQVLSDPNVRGRRVPLLVACNKQDIALAKSPSTIRAQLEKELNSLRESRLAALDSTDTANARHSATLGRWGQPFSFDHLSNRVQFVGTSGLEQKEHTLDPVRDWLRKNV